jgi:EmrB/QacA subfamily drug resistance transporter
LNRNNVLAAAVLASFLTPFMASSVNIALPAISAEFSMSAVTLSWVALSFLLAAAMFLIPLGRAADLYGRKKIFKYGVAIYTVASLLSAVSPAAPFLIAVRFVQGLGGAMIFGTGMAILTSVFPPGERGRVLGWNVAAVYLGLSLGPVLGGFMIQHFGWRSIFILNVPLGIAAFYILQWKVKEEWSGLPGTFDFRGSFLYCLSLAALMTGLSELTQPKGKWLAAAGLLLLLLFLFDASRSPHPLLEVNLFRRNMTLTFSSLAALINYSATFAVGFLLSLYLQYAKGLSPQAAGAILVAQPVMMMLLSPLAGRLSDRVEPRIVASAGMGLTALGLFSLIFLTAQTPVAYLAIALLVIGTGLGLFASPNTNAVMSSSKKQYLGVVSATLGTMRLTGQMLSVGISLLILSFHLGHARITRETVPLFMKSQTVAFAVFAALCALGVLASLFRGNVRSGEGPTIR